MFAVFGFLYVNDFLSVPFNDDLGQPMALSFLE
jgi:hypothetical protein